MTVQCDRIGRVAGDLEHLEAELSDLDLLAMHQSSLLARDAFGYDDVASARIGTISFWVRPFAAVAAGLLGDRISASRAINLSFGVLVAGACAIAAGFLRPDMYWMIAGTVAGFTLEGRAPARDQLLLTN